MAPIMLVGKGVSGRHGARQRDFHRLGGVAFEETQGLKHGRAPTPHWSGHPSRVYQLIAVAAAPGRDLYQTAEVDPFYPFAKAPDVMPPALLTVGDDIQTGLLLVSKGEKHGIILPFFQDISLQLRGHIHLIGWSEPGRSG